MPGKSKSSTLKDRSSSRKSAGQARSHNTSTSTSQTASDSDEQSNEDDEGDKTPTAGKAAVKASSAAQEMQKTPATPTKHSRELLAGLDLSGATSTQQGSNTYQMEDAITRKVSELTASGWRPEEELDGLSIEDDDLYNGVDLISHSDEDDNAIRKEESRSFRQPDMSLVEQGDLARRLSLSDAGSDLMEWNGFDDVDFAPGEEPPSSAFGLSRFLDYDETRPASFLLADDESTFPRETKITSDNQRKVRFQDEVDGSDGDSSDEEELSETFPDIFMEAPQFTPSFQRTHGEDLYVDDGSDAGSVWDFEGEEPDAEREVEDDDEEDSWSESDGSSSGYDSDEGETTDEEEPCPPPKRAVASTANSVESPTKSEDATPRMAPPAATVTPSTRKRINSKSKAGIISPDAGTPRLPKAGTFDMDPRRNVLLVDGAGASQRNTLYPARIQTADERRYWQKMHQAYKNRTSTPHTSVQMSPADCPDDFEVNSDFFDPTSPFDSIGSLLSHQIIGPPEAFLPFTSVDASGTITEDTSMVSASEDEDDDMDLLSPFVNFDDSKQDDEDDSADTSDCFESLTRSRSNTFPSMSSPAPATPVQTPSINRRDTLGSPFGGDLFSHLSRSKGLVHSFRMNQHYAKHMASYAADPTARYSTSEMNAMQTGRRKAANTPITPMRKKRGGSLSKIGKVDWTKGLGVEKMGPPATPGRDGMGHFKRPSSSGNGMANGKKGPAKGLFR